MNAKFKKYAEIRADDALLVARMVNGRTREKSGPTEIITHLTPDAQNAKAELIEKHTPFIKIKVDKHCDIGDIPFEDRIVHGLSGFGKSLDTVDTSNSNTLLRHSEPFIKAAIVDASRSDTGAIALGRSTWELIHKIEKISDKISTEWHRATPEEITQYIKKETPKFTISATRVREAQRVAYINKAAPSNNQPREGDTESSMQFDRAAKSEEPEHACIKAEEEERIRQLVWDALDTLDSRARDIITHRPPYNGEPNDKDTTLQASANRWGISKQGVDRIERKAHEHIRRHIKRHSVPEIE